MKEKSTLRYGNDYGPIKKLPDHLQSHLFCYMGTITNVYELRGYGFSYVYEVLFPEFLNRVNKMDGANSKPLIHSTTLLQDIDGCLSLKGDVDSGDVSKVKKSLSKICETEPINTPDGLQGESNDIHYSPSRETEPRNAHDFAPGSKERNNKTRVLCKHIQNLLINNGDNKVHHERKAVIDMDHCTFPKPCEDSWWIEELQLLNSNNWMRSLKVDGSQPQFKWRSVHSSKAVLFYF